MSVKIGISPIAWQNDDLPDMTKDYTMDQALQESRKIGYAGVERGRRMPQDTEGLRDYLIQNELSLCGGWCSGNLMVNSVKEEIEAIQQQVEQFAALDAPCVVYAECSNTVQGDISIPLSRRPKLGRDEVLAYGAKLSEVAKWSRDQGVPISYHHHMGSMVQDEDDINWLLEGSDSALQLCFDTGHLVFGGGDLDRVLSNWAHRINHVHFKDVRPDVISEIEAINGSFLDAVMAGAFTVPGDGAIDFQAVAHRLKMINYKGWIVVEAEQDPRMADPYVYSKAGYEHILEVCSSVGISVVS